MFFSLLNYSFKRGETNTRVSVGDRNANPFKKAAVLINVHWPRIVFYAINSTIWHGWPRRDNLEISGYPFQSVLVSNMETKQISSQETVSEPEITMLDLWYIGKAYFHFESKKVLTIIIGMYGSPVH